MLCAFGLLSSSIELFVSASARWLRNSSFESVGFPQGHPCRLVFAFCSSAFVLEGDMTVRTKTGHWGKRPYTTEKHQCCSGFYALLEGDFCQL